MPYVDKHTREQLPDTFFDALERLPVAGDLNYLFTTIAIEYLLHNGLRYQYINDIVGALEGAKLEFTRRLTNDYEDLCIDKNGDLDWVLNMN